MANENTELTKAVIEGEILQWKQKKEVWRVRYEVNEYLELKEQCEGCKKEIEYCVKAIGKLEKMAAGVAEQPK